MSDFTLNDLMDFARNEKKMVEEVLPHSLNKDMEPSDESLNNILNFSQAYSVRRSARLEHIRIVLN